jgi:hypothetical protein
MLLFVALILGAVVRPLGMVLALAGTEVPWSERAYLAFIGPRGIVALATASYAALAVSGRGQEMETMLGVTFMVIFLSGTLTTLLGRPLARVLGVRLSVARSGLVLVGVNPLTLELSRFARKRVAVSFLETEKPMCSILERGGEQPLCIDVLDDEVYADAREEGYGRLVAATPDDALNHLICQRAAEYFGEDNVYSVQWRKRLSIQVEPATAGCVAFGRDFYLAEVIQAVEAGHARFLVTDFGDLEAGGRHALFALTPDNGLRVVTADDKPQGRVFAIIQGQGPHAKAGSREAREDAARETAPETDPETDPDAGTDAGTDADPDADPDHGRG